MQANYDQQIEEVSRSKQEGWQAEMKRMQGIILRLQNANTSVAQLDEKVLFGTDERKAVIQDVYSSVCTYFDPDGDERDTIQYSTNDVLRRIRSALKSMI